jgi:hypothetical protein
VLFSQKADKTRQKCFVLYEGSPIIITPKVQAKMLLYFRAPREGDGQLIKFNYINTDEEEK